MGLSHIDCFEDTVPRGHVHGVTWCVRVATAVGTFVYPAHLHYMAC